MKKIISVIVAFQPDIALLCRVLDAIAPQVSAALLIANDGAPWSIALPANVTLARQNENLGLGAAYNLAVRWARGHAATHILLLDQDSVAAPSMVVTLEQALNKADRAAAAGPLWHDRRTQRPGFFAQLTPFGVRKHYPAPGSIVPVDFLISSGSLISLAAIEAIGPFDEILFLEHIDTDWSFRARASGYRLYGVSEARLEHGFGQATKEFAILGFKRALYLYPPERNYYLLRNSIALWRRSYVPWRWTLHDIRRMALLMSYYALFEPPRLFRLKKMLSAVRDGLRMDQRHDR